ncbi:MAG: lantibiotic dehydratase, partial [Pseudonocardiales bacterium]|nr:lantibiotic dehydratase [Pseudonocardiales bacterium]
AAAQPCDRRRSARCRVSVGARMRRLSAAGRTPLAVDVRLDAEVQLPTLVAAELEHAATALLRLDTPSGWIAGLDRPSRRVPGPVRVGTLVPLREALDPDAGLGYPAGSGSTLAGSCRRPRPGPGPGRPSARTGLGTARCTDAGSVACNPTSDAATVPASGASPRRWCRRRSSRRRSAFEMWLMRGGRRAWRIEAGRRLRRPHDAQARRTPARVRAARRPRCRRRPALWMPPAPPTTTRP